MNVLWLIVKMIKLFIASLTNFKQKATEVVLSSLIQLISLGKKNPSKLNIGHIMKSYADIDTLTLLLIN